eukprot:9974168-Lingulodinium_polyedra.AAC.1
MRHVVRALRPLAPNLDFTQKDMANALATVAKRNAWEMEKEWAKDTALLLRENLRAIAQAEYKSADRLPTW